MKRPFLQFVFLALVVFSAVAASFAQAAQGISPERKEAFEQFVLGNYDRALVLLEPYIKKNPGDAEAWNAIGVANIRSGNPKDAIEALQKAVKYDPANSVYTTNLAQAYIGGNKLGPALKASEKAIALDPKNRAAYLAKGSVFLLQGRSTDAIAIAEYAIGLDKTYSPAYILKADALLQIFGGKISDDVSEIDDLTPLNQSILLLQTCLKECDRSLNPKTLPGRLDSLIAFHKYFTPKIPGAAPVKIEPQPAVTPLIITHKELARYTEEARKNQVFGRIRLAVLFFADGKTKYFFPLSKLAYGLTERAMAAASKIEFIPQKVDGKPVSVVKIVEYNFELP